MLKGANDADGTNPGKEAVRQVYREYTPHYPLLPNVAGNGTIQQSFWIGKVKFILTDCRSARDPEENIDTDNKSMLGLEQRSWLLAELDASKSAGLVVWVVSVPWVSDKGGEGWGKYNSERAIIANTISSLNLRIVVLAGDAHMLAMDDGRNNKFSPLFPQFSFPAVQSASLDRSPSVKGGPYFFGCSPGSGKHFLFSLIFLFFFVFREIHICNCL